MESRRSTRLKRMRLTTDSDDDVAHVGSRPRRSNREPPVSAAASRPSTTTGDGGATKSIRLTMKAPGDSSRDSAGGSKKSTVNPSGDSLEAAGVVTGPRGTRAKRPIVDEESESEEEDRSGDEAEEDEEEAEDGEQEDDGDEEDEDDEDEQEGEVELDEDDEGEDQEGSDEDNEDADAEGESDEDVRPTQANRKAASGTSLPKGRAGKSRARPAVTRPPSDSKSGRVEDVKDRPTDDDDDREASAVDSDGDRVSEDGDGAEGEADAEDNVEEQADDDAEEDGGEEEEDEGEEDEDEDDDDGDDDDDDEEDATPATGSRASTPDLSKMTKRQRSRLVELGGELLQLPSETKVKKVLTAEEHAMRRAEMARRRKNLSEKRKEEEKIDTINKLLKKQAPKQRRTARNPETGGDASPSNQEAEFERPKDIFVRWVSSSRGNVVGVPEEWIGTPVGNVFEPDRGDEHTAKKERRPMLKTVLIKS